ncbi:MAG TPA: hypothetical protein PLB78_14770, partial [Anaerolineae bacterium]|nr:hypothetical protein [Anaerolineae bacterium]
MRTNGEQAARVPAWPWERLPHGRWLGRLALAALVLFWAWALAGLPLTNAAALLVAAVVGVAMLLWPALGLALLAVAVPFGSLRSISLGPAQVGAAEMLLAVTAAVWLVRQLARRSLRPTWPAFGAAGLALMGAMLLSFLPASSFALAVKEMLKWAELWLAALLVLNAVDAAGALLLALGLLAAGAAQGLLGAYQFFARVGPPEFVLMGRFMRAAGTFHQPNPYGGFLGLTLPLAVGLLLSAWPARGRNRPSGAVQPQQAGASDAPTAGEALPSRRVTLAIWLAAAVGGGLIALGLFASWSRGAWLGAAAAVAAVVLA